MAIAEAAIDKLIAICLLRQTAKEQELFQHRIAIILGAGIISMVHCNHGIAGTWRVVNVSANDTLAIREFPNANSSRLGDIPAEGAGIQVVECLGVSSVETLETFTDESVKKTLANSWCRVRYGAQIGWVSANYLLREKAQNATPDLPPSDLPVVWLTIASSATADGATAIAMKYAPQFPFVTVVAGKNSRFSVVLGAGFRDVMEQHRQDLIADEPSATLFSGDANLAGLPPLRAIEWISLADPAFSADVGRCRANVWSFLLTMPPVESLCSGHGPTTAGSISSPLIHLTFKSASWQASTAALSAMMSWRVESPSSPPKSAMTAAHGKSLTKKNVVRSAEHTCRKRI